MFSKVRKKIFHFCTTFAPAQDMVITQDFHTRKRYHCWHHLYLLGGFGGSHYFTPPPQNTLTPTSPFSSKTFFPYNIYTILYIFISLYYYKQLKSPKESSKYQNPIFLKFWKNLFFHLFLIFILDFPITCLVIKKKIIL